MNKRRSATILAAHADQLTHPGEMAQPMHLSAEERQELNPLFRVAEMLQQTLRPVEPRDDFVQRVKQDLNEQAKQQAESKQRLQRILAIAAAALGSLLSIASVVGAILLLVRRLHKPRAHAAPAAPTG